jgi:hypothetical protein
MTVTLGTDMSLTPRATAQWADQRIKREGSPRRTKGSNPCTLQSGYWLVDIIDWSSRAGLPGVAREIPVF